MTSGTANIVARFVFESTPVSIYSTQSVLDAGSREVLSSAPVVIASGAISVSLPTTTNPIVVLLQTIPGLNWTTLPAQTLLHCETSDGSGNPLDTVTGVVVRPREPTIPSVRIVSPQSGLAVEVTRPVTFQAIARDSVDGNLPSTRVVCISSLQGVLGSGGFATTTMVAGTHRITAAVRNSAGTTGSEDLTLYVTPPVPVVQILSPAITSTLQYPAALALQGQASDDLSLTFAGGALNWRSNIDGLTGTGQTVTVTPSVGSHAFTLTATNVYGGQAEARVLVEVLPPVPQITLLSPPSGFFAIAGNTVHLTAAVSVPDGVTVTETAVVWISDKQGALGSGQTTSTTSLWLGRHGLAAIARNSYATTRSAVATGTIVPPTSGVVIISPAPGATFETGLPVLVEGLGSNPTIGPYPEAGASWRSNLQGMLVSGHSMYETTALTDGLHTLTFEISDPQSQRLTAVVDIRVAKRAPRVSIELPERGAAYAAGAAVTLQATGYDLLLGPLNVGAFQWMEGVRVMASGPMAVATGLGLGSHTLTLLATGPAGGTAVSTVGLLVTSSPVTDPVSVSGQIRSTSGVPLNGVAVSVSEKATGRAVACVTPALAGQGAYWVQFVSAPRSVGPTQTTTYEFSLEMGGVLRSSIPASITVSSGTTRFGQIVQELLVP